MKKYLFSFIVLLFSSASSQLTVAVLDFEGIGVSENEARALSGRFGNEFMILSKGVYTLVERNRMGQILKEQGFQNTGIVSSEDAVKLGEALGADYIVTGSISKVGALFSINARLLKVESGEIIKSSSHDHMGDIMDLMRKGIKESATKLLELEEKKETPSIAILPFENKGADEDAFYAYGIGADLVSDVTGAGLIRVAGLKDVEKIDYLNMSYDEMAKSLLVRYVAQGTLWKLGGLFQLSLEIFDTKSSQVIFTKRWQTEWGNLTTIKDDLSSNILETLEIEVKRGTPNKFTIDTEAYEFYLKGKHAFQKAQTIEERQIARGLFERAVEIDEDIIEAKLSIARIYWLSGDEDDAKKAKEIRESALKQAEEIGDEKNIGNSLRTIGLSYLSTFEHDKALEYFEKSLKIFEEMGNQERIGLSLNGIGNVYWRKGELEKALEYYERFLSIGESLDDKNSIGMAYNNLSLIHQGRENWDEAIEVLNKALNLSRETGSAEGEAVNLQNIGWVYQNTGNGKEALPYIERAIQIRKNFAQKNQVINLMNMKGWAQTWMGDYENAYNTFSENLQLSREQGEGEGLVWNLHGIGTIHFMKGEYQKAEELLDQVLQLREKNEIEWGELQLTAYKFLLFKKLGKDYDIQNIHALLKEQNLEDLNETQNFRLYQLLGDHSYLLKAHEEVQKRADKLQGEAKENYLNYPVEKQIIEEYSLVMK